MDTETGIPVNPTEWKNGTVVALKSHFYTEKVNSDIIVYSGEPKIISPLMVIVETTPEKKSYHPTTGDLIDGKDDKNFQCKCIWFSSKNFHFEEVWISSRLLRIIKPVDELVNYKYGDLVELRGSEIELGKKKSSLKFKNNQNETSVTAELSFVSPIMQVIGTTKNEIKEPLRDLNTQRPKRFISKTLVKCKYYNSASEKMTEVLIPIDALSKIPEFNKDALEPLKDAIERNKHLILTFPSAKEGSPPKKILVDPKKINYRAGRYYVSAFNLFNAMLEEFAILLTKYEILESWYSEELPSFKLVSNKVNGRLINAENIKHLIDKVGKEKYYWIIYKDFKDDETKRVISDVELVGEEQGKDLSEEVSLTYLKAYCHLRQATRVFKVDGIKAIKVLNI
ncbi:hypothetical protein CNR22_23245 [Sphingobacteriaceae bacterium]|nr:hypothetical protein CNR22_23245 [Sphingobacteriaceae bacterium]